MANAASLNRLLATSGLNPEKLRLASSFVLLNYAQAGLSLVTTWFLALQFGKEQFGVYALGLVVGGIITIVGSFAEDKTLVRDLISAHEPSAVLIHSTVLRFALTATATFGLTLYLLSEHDLAEAKLLIACGIAGALLAITPRAWFDCRQKMSTHALLQFLERFGFASAIFTLWLFGALSLPTAVFSLFVCRVALLSSQFLLARKLGLSANVHVDWSAILQLAKGSAPVYVASIGNLLMSHVNQVILATQLGNAQIAAYGLAMQIVAVVLLLQGQVLRLVAPSIAHATLENAHKARLKKLLHYCGAALVASCCLTIPMLALSATLLPEVLPNQYLSILLPLRILLCWVTALGPGLIVNQFLICERCSLAYATIAIASGAFSLGLSWVAIPTLGATGAAVSLLVAHSISMLTQFLWLLKSWRRKRIH